MGIRILLALVLATSVGCRAEKSAPQREEAVEPKPMAAAPLPLEPRLGWVIGNCLATANKNLTADSPIAVVSLGGTSSIVDGRIVGPTSASETCPPLLPDRRTSNQSKWLFYELKLPATVDLGIAVTGDLTRVDGAIDLSGDGVPETFTQCATAEGVSFAVWSGTPYRGAPLWSGYYYLGYDTEVTCPS